MSTTELPPVVVTPTYATADARLEWLNRAQCIGVGRVDMTALRVEFDVYVVRVGERTRQASLYDRLGGPDVIAAVTDDFVAGVLGDRHLEPVLYRHARFELEAESHRSSVRDNRRTLRLQGTRHEGGS